MQVLFFNLDKATDIEDQKWWQFDHFLTYILTRTEKNLEQDCKIKFKILRL